MSRRRYCQTPSSLSCLAASAAPCPAVVTAQRSPPPAFGWSLTSTFDPPLASLTRYTGRERPRCKCQHFRGASPGLQDARFGLVSGFVHHSNLVSSRFLPPIKNEQIGFLSFAPTSWPCITYLEERGIIPPPSRKGALRETSENRTGTSARPPWDATLDLT